MMTIIELAAIVGGIAAGNLLGAALVRRVRDRQDHRRQAEIVAVVALAERFPDARIESPSGVVYEPQVCQGTACEPDDGGELQPDGTRVFGCLHCTRKWTAWSV